MQHIDENQNGIVIDHIKAGTAIGLMALLGLKGNRTSSVALIQNARSHKAESGRKDNIKVEGDASRHRLAVLANLDPDISVTVIERSDSTVSIQEDLSYRSIADREDRALEDGATVMEYVQ